MRTVIFFWLCISTSLCCVASDASSTSPFHLTFREIAKDVWLAQRPDPMRLPVMGNGLIIITKDHVTLVDGVGSRAMGRQIVAKVQQLTDLPVRFLVISHWHGDHNLGAQPVLDAWPDARLIAHSFTRQAMLGAPMDYVAQSKATIHDTVRNAETAIASGRDTLPPAVLEKYQDFVNWGDTIATEVEAFDIVPPQITFTDRLTLHAGPPIELLHFGYGNTKGDVIVWLPRQRIVFTGDTVVYPVPFGFGSYVSTWPQVLQDILDLEPALIVPGHGDPMSDGGYLGQLQELFSDVWTQVRPLASSGLEIDEVRERVSLEKHRALFAKDDAWLQSRFDAWFATPIVEAAFNEASGIENEALHPQDHGH